MPIDRKEAERLARDLIAQVASEWEMTPLTHCIEENGAHIFVFTLAPGGMTHDGQLYFMSWIVKADRSSRWLLRRGGFGPRRAYLSGQFLLSSDST